MDAAGEAARAWLDGQGGRRGFSVEELAVQDYQVRKMKRKRGRFATFGVLDLGGVLTVRDPGSVHQCADDGLRPRQGFRLRLDAGAPRLVPGPGQCRFRVSLPPKPIPLKERAALVFVERARLDVKDGAFVAINADGTRIHIPVGGVACLMLEPGARISHSAVALAARAGTL